MVGSSGGDILQGGSGSDVLTGGGGNDSFVFGSSADLGADRITDFLGVSQMGGDKIYFGSFSGLSFGMHLNSNLFFSGTMDDFAASGAGERVIFDQSLGNLYYDSDGAAGSTKLVAHFDGGANVVADDILQSS